MPIHYGAHHWPEPQSVRAKQLAERWNKVADKIERTPRVRVVPANDEIRKGISHPDGYLKFPEGTGSVEWPLDSFTQRRLYDGTVSLASGQRLDPKIEQLIPHHATYVESGHRVITPSGVVPSGVAATPHDHEAEQRRMRARPSATEPPKT